MPPSFIISLMKIKKYPLAKPVDPNDKVIGSRSSSDNATLNYSIGDIAGFAAGILGASGIFFYSDGSNEEIGPTTPGYFLTEENIIDIQDVTEIYLNKINSQLVDITELIELISELEDKFVLKIVNTKDPNNIVYFRINNIVLDLDGYFKIQISLYDPNSYNGQFINLNEYSFTFDIIAIPVEKTKLSEFENDGDGESRFTTIDDIYIGKNVNFPATITLRPFRVLERNNRYFTDISCEDLIRGKLSKMLPYYVNYETGSDSNNGLKETLPFKTIAAAYTAGARLIYLASGIHKNDSWGSINDSYTNTDDLFIIGTGDKPTYITSAPASNPVYTLQSGATYQCTLSVAKSVVDMKYLDKKGFPLRLDFKSSIAEVNASPGSYWVDDTTVYVHLKDGRVPDSSVINLTRNNSGKYRGNQGYHFVKNVIFMGGSLTCGTHGVESQTGVGSTLISFQKSCQFLYGESGLYNNNGGEGTRNVNNYLTWSEDCVSYGNARDGFNYLAETGVGNKVVEIRCQGFDNGLRLTSSSVNGSSNHGGGVSSQVIRVDCKYYRNSGPNVIDIDGCQTANFGVTGFESVAPIGPDNNNVDFGIGGLAGGIQYNYGCVSRNGISFRIGGVNECHIINDPNTIYTGSLIIETPSAPQSITFEEFATADVVKTELPLLSAYTAAPTPVTKLYTSVGTNTDGGLDQNTATNLLADKQSLTLNNTITGTQTYSNLTASALIALNGSKNLVSLSTSTYPSFAEIAYLKGVTSAVQTQLNSKPTIGYTAPATSTSAGVKGEIRITSTYTYFCIDTNIWVRAAAATW